MSSPKPIDENPQNRRAHRYATCWPVTIRHAQGSDHGRAIVVSTTGLLFCSPAEYVNGESMEVEIGPDSGNPFSATIEIVHKQVDEDGNFLYGGRFLGLSVEQQVHLHIGFQLFGLGRLERLSA